jgi:hypothetical protein
MVTTTITLTKKLLVLGGLGDVMALELASLVLNMFYTSIFLGHSQDVCFMLEQIIQ